MANTPRTAAKSAALLHTLLHGSPASRDPSITQADLRDSLEWCGLRWASSHVIRKTTATLLDDAGLSARSIANQLGHAQPSQTQKVCMRGKIASNQGSRRTGAVPLGGPSQLQLMHLQGTFGYTSSTPVGSGVAR